MKKIMLIVMLALGVNMTISAQNVLKDFQKDARDAANMWQINTENINRILGGKKVKEDYCLETHIQSVQTDYEALLFNKEIKIDVSQTSILVETIHGSRFIERRDYGQFLVAEGLHYGSAAVMNVLVQNNSENTVIQFRIGNERVIKTYRVHQYTPTPMNKKIGGVNHRSVYRPRPRH